MQQIFMVARKIVPGVDNKKDKKRAKTASLHLFPAVYVAAYLAHKARFIGSGVFNQIHKIKTLKAKSVGDALRKVDP